MQDSTEGNKGNEVLQAKSLLILGADGQLGSSFVRRLGAQAISWTRGELDLARFDLLADAFKRGLDVLPEAPAAVINCAAYTKVDLAEKEPELCRAINTDAVRVLARVCEQRGLRFVHFSTDYVFSGGDGHDTPYRETDKPSPQGVYARTKLDGEAAAAECARHLVIRTCGLYGRLNKAGQGNFVETILRLAKQKPELRIVNDQHCTPSAVEDIVTGISPVEHSDACGLFHIVNSGATTWYDLARELLRLENIATQIIQITTAEFNAPAPRPRYSVLDSSKFNNTIGIALPPWQAALAKYLRERP
jgi:dTDP-4-dehydrorhamnose reductase